MMTRKDALKAVRKREGSPFYVFDYTDGATGRRVRKRTRYTDKEEAVSALLAAVNGTDQKADTYTLLDLLGIFSDPKTNPKYREAQSDGSNYGYSHADHVAKASIELTDILRKDARHLLSKRLTQLKIVDIRTIKEIIVERIGRRRKSQSMFANLKSMFSYANSVGWIERNPAAPVGNIRYEKVERVAVDILVIRKALTLHTNRVIDDRTLAFFLVVASTGMRRGEAMALSTSQIRDGVLDIRLNMKKGEDSNVSLGLPKWDQTRRIPLPQVTLDALARVRPEGGRYFPNSFSWADEAMKRVVSAMCAAYPEDAEDAMRITCHVLRHSLNTALKLIGCPEMMLDQWFGWSEGRKTMQSRYTHIYAKDLKPVANTIDFLFSERFTGFNIGWQEGADDTPAYFDNRPSSHAGQASRGCTPLGSGELSQA